MGCIDTQLEVDPPRLVHQRMTMTVEFVELVSDIEDLPSMLTFFEIFRDYLLAKLALLL